MYFGAFAWILIPLAAILAGAWTEWLKFKEKQANLGASTESLEASFEELSRNLAAQNESLIKRIQNLEAIVTSADWDRITADETLKSLPEPEPEILLPDPEEENREEAERIARRMRS